MTAGGPGVPLYSHLVFTAPTGGLYSIVAEFRGDQYNVHSDVHVLGNGSSLFSATITSVGQTQSYTGTVTLSAGQTLDFATGADGAQSLGPFNTGVSAVITVVPILGRLALSSDVLTGGVTGTGTVTLTYAPSSATTVTLTSSDPAAASVPATITVPAGKTSATFPITSYSVADYTPVTITATANGASKSALLIVTPAGSPTLTFNPTSVIGGMANSTGTITLPGPAPVAVKVALASSDPLTASVPASVTIPAGATSVTFPVTIYPVSSSTLVAILASSNGVSITTTLTVLP